MSEADLEQLVFLGPKGADEVSDVIPDHNHLPTLRVLWSEHGHSPGNHPDLEGGREGGKRIHETLHWLLPGVPC